MVMVESKWQTCCYMLVFVRLVHKSDRPCIFPSDPWIYGVVQTLKNVILTMNLGKLQMYLTEILVI